MFPSRTICGSPLRPSGKLLPALLLALAAHLPHAAHAWNSDVATNTAVSTGTGTQYHVQAASDNTGGCYLTWEDDRNSGNDIYAQHLDAQGQPLWTSGGIAVCNAAKHQTLPQVISDGAGGAIVAWQDNRSGMAHIYAQKLRGDTGAAQWTPNGVLVCTAGGYELSPKMVSDTAGGAIITWQDFRLAGDGSGNIYAQRITSADGASLWAPAGVSVCAAAGDQGSPVIVPDGAGGAVIAWEDQRSSTSDIYAQRLGAAAGLAQWAADGIPVCAATGNQNAPALISDHMGGAIIIWWDFRNASKWNIYAQRVSAENGARLWSPNDVAVTTATINRGNMAVTDDDLSDAIIAWEDSHRGMGIDIFAQKLMKDTGAPEWTLNGVGTCIAPDNQTFPQLIPDGQGGAIATWQDHRNGYFDIYAERLAGATGTSEWTTDGVPVCLAPYDQLEPTITEVSPGGAVIAWQDLRAQADYDIYASFISTAGTAAIQDWELF